MRSHRPRTTALVLSAALALVVALGACGSDDDGGGGADAGGDATDAPATGTTTDDPYAGSGPPPEPTGGDVTVATAETDLGEILVDGEGFTLYIFTQDGPGESTCGPGCIELWPAASVDGAPTVDDGLDAVQFGTIERDDGTTQLTVDDQPLYRYTPDGAPGDTTGQGVGGVWFVVGPDGTAIR